MLARPNVSQYSKQDKQRFFRSMQALIFEPFAFVPEQRLLLEAGVPVHIGARALQLLVILLERRGNYVSHSELIAHVWPKTIVEDSNLRVQMTLLRKILHDGVADRRYIHNDPGRGYQFVAPVVRVENSPTLKAEREEKYGILPPVKTLYGRQDSLEQLSADIERHPLVTIAGPGGIGKTSLAVAVAAARISKFADGVHFIDLSAIMDPILVIPTISVILGIPMGSGNAIPSLTRQLRSSAMLLVLDNCEHVIDVVAKVADALVRTCPQIHILATSREPLLIENERIHRLGPLRFPSSAPLSVNDALQFPAIRMFVERAQMADRAFSVGDDDVHNLVEICRRVDGIPLAIELAVSRLELFGLAGLRKQLGDLFAILTQGQRTVLPRHRTLRTTLDWSFGLLSQREKALLECLSQFKTQFSLDAALAVADAELGRDKALSTMGALISKSLLISLGGETEPSYRLLEVTRAYVLEHLEKRPDMDVLRHRYASCICGLFTRAEAETAANSSEIWLERYGQYLDDVRSVLEWALGRENDIRLGIQLITSSAPLWIHRYLFDGYQAWIQAAIACGTRNGILEPQHKLRLYTALGHLLLQTQEDLEAARLAFDRAFEAVANGSATERCQGLAALWVSAIIRADYPAALEYGLHFRMLCDRQDPLVRLVCNRMLAIPNYHLGRHHLAREQTTISLDQGAPTIRLARTTGIQSDLRNSIEVVMPRAAWLEGRPDEALERVYSSVDWARSNVNTGSVCYVLAVSAAPIALWTGDWTLASSFIGELEEIARAEGLRGWERWAACLSYALAVQRGSQSQCGAFDTSTCGNLQIDFLATLGVESVQLRCIERLRAGLTGWCGPEALRARAESIAASSFLDGRSEVEGLLMQALALAQEQGANAWELRIASSIAKLSTNSGEARTADLVCALAKIQGGSKTQDVIAAHSLL